MEGGGGGGGTSDSHGCLRGSQITYWCVYTVLYLGSQSPRGKTRQKGKEERQKRKKGGGRQGRKEGRKEERKPVLGERNDGVGRKD
jgi:hypothetical protein